MDQGSDDQNKAELKPLSVLKGGKKEPAGGTAGTKENRGAVKKSSADTSEGSAKVSSLIHGLAQHMISKTPDLPAFPHKLYVMKDEDGQRFIMEENDRQEICRVGNDIVSFYLLEFIKSCGFPLGMNKIISKDVKHAVQEFLAYGPRIKEPELVLQSSTPGLTYRKLPFDFENDPGLERSPTFKEMMSRTTNSRALMAWIGSLFDPNADMRQYIWIFGAGRNGKSTLGRFLSSVFGTSARSVQPPGIGDKFWTINLVGKRLVIYADCNNAKFVTSGLFKSMTGGDPVSAEIKLGATLQVVLKAKHLFFSNKKPGIDSGEADQSRIILCEMAPIAGSADAFYEDRLWQEASTFLGECINTYLDDAGPRTMIPCDQKAARELAQDNDEFFDSVFHQYFVARPGKSMPANEFIDRLKNVGIKSGPDIQRFRDYIEKAFGVTRARIPGAGFMYLGIVRNHPTDI